MSHPRKLRLGIIGAGYAAEHLHAQAWRRIPAIEVAHVADLDPARASRLAALFPGSEASSSAEHIFSSPRTDAAVILTPTRSHRSLVLAALRAGKHVFVEKPLALDSREAAELAEAATLSGCVTAVGHNMRCHRLVRRARSLAYSGELGEILAVRTVWTSPGRTGHDYNEDPGSAVLLDLGVHHIDIVQYLTGDAVESCSVVPPACNPGLELTGLSGSLKRGALFTFVLGRRGVYQHTVSITGAKAAIEFSCHRANSWRSLRAGQDLGIRAQFSETKEYLWQVPALARAYRTGGDWLESYRVQWESFVSAVLEGSPVPCSFADAASAVNICAALARVGTAV